MKNKDLLLALTLLIILGTVRGGAVSISKFVTVSGVPPLGYAFWQTGLAAALLFAIRIQKFSELPPFLPYIRYYVVCGLIGAALPNALFFISVKHIPAGTMAIVLTTVPLIIYSFVLLLKMEKPDLWRALGIMVAFVGAILIATTDFSGEFRVNWFVVLAFLCPAGYSVASVYIAKFPIQGADPILLAAGTLAMASAFLLPLSIFSRQFHPLWNDPDLPELFILIHSVIAATAYTLFFRIVQLAGPVFYSQSTYLIAITGIAWGMLIFDEKHGDSFWIATTLIMAGLTIINIRQARRFPDSTSS